MSRINQFNQVQGSPHGVNDRVVAGVLHRTYSPTVGSAFNAILNGGTAHTLLGDGHSDEFMDMTERAFHANGANWLAIGAEFHGTNEDPLTDDQIRDLATLLVFGRDVMGIPIVYLDPFSQPPASVHVNAGVYSGWLSHYSVQTDDGSAQHTDLVTMEDFNRAVAFISSGQVPPAGPPGDFSGTGSGELPAPTPGDGQLSLGDTGAEVQHWQSQLKAYASQDIDVDGVFGPLTEEATKSFQRFFLLDVDGVVGPDTQEAMNRIAGDRHRAPSAAPAPPFPGREMKLGDQGDDVRQWQAQMAARGWTIDVDGVFRPLTDTVVRQFQQEKDLQVDGVIGLNTWGAAWTAPLT